MNYLRITVKRFFLFLWRELPMPEWARDLALYLINHKFIVGVCAVITDKDGRILLFHHTYLKGNPWGLPGGAAKRENLRTALRRELEEESGFEIEVHNLIGIVHAKGRQINYLFLCSLKRDNFKASEEVDDFGFYFLNELPATASRQREIFDALKALTRRVNTWPRVDMNIQGFIEFTE